jgi:hypothetical protein
MLFAEEGIVNKRVWEINEDYSRAPANRSSSDRVFGLVFSAVFAVFGLLPIVHSGVPRYWALVVGLVFCILALSKPAMLHPLNLAWIKSGLLLHAVVNPIVMALLFFGTVTPIAFLLRIAGKDPLRLKLDRSSTTYWIERSPPGPPPASIKNQF